jgi:hypothetical protein
MGQGIDAGSCYLVVGDGSRKPGSSWRPFAVRLIRRLITDATGLGVAR